MITGGISVDIGETQKKLSQWAEKDKISRFYDLYHLLYQEDWLGNCPGPRQEKRRKSNRGM